MVDVCVMMSSTTMFFFFFFNPGSSTKAFWGFGILPVKTKNIQERATQRQPSQIKRTSTKLKRESAHPAKHRQKKNCETWEDHKKLATHMEKLVDIRKKVFKAELGMKPPIACAWVDFLVVGQLLCQFSPGWGRSSPIAKRHVEAVGGIIDFVRVKKRIMQVRICSSSVGHAR